MTKTNKAAALQLARRLYIPKAAQIIHADPARGIEVHGYTTPRGLVAAVAFHGKRGKPDWHYSYKTPEALARKVKEWLDGIAQWQGAVADRRAKANAPHTLQVGDVLRSSWGYDQTNIDYYQITKLIGRSHVEIRPIRQISTAGGWTGKCAPDVGNFAGEPMRKKVNAAQNGVRIESYAFARKIEPQMVAGVKTYDADNWTAYA